MSSASRWSDSCKMLLVAPASLIPSFLSCPPFILLLPHLLSLMLFGSSLLPQFIRAGCFRWRVCRHHYSHNNLCSRRVSDQPDRPQPVRICALCCCWKHCPHVGSQQVRFFFPVIDILYVQFLFFFHPHWLKSSLSCNLCLNIQSLIY